MISDGPVGAEALLEDLLGERQAALGDVRPRGHHVAELGEHRLGLGAADRLEPGDLGGDRLDLGLGEVREHRRGPLAAELDQEDGGLADAEVRPS